MYIHAQACTHNSHAPHLKPVDKNSIEVVLRLGNLEKIGKYYKRDNVLVKQNKQTVLYLTCSMMIVFINVVLFA